MEELFSFQNNLLSQVDNRWHRYLYPEMLKDHRLFGLKGLRGVGKTTMFLQYLAHDYPNRDHGLYVTADHPYFYSHTLFDVASDWYKLGGKLLLIDEVHKYPNWSRELKLMYDGHPDLKVMFTSSSALDLYRGESDLSRRLSTRVLHGLSFREYLNLFHNIAIESVSLNELLADHTELSRHITKDIKILPLFKQYLHEGYFPFSAGGDDSLPSRLLRVINTVLENDLAMIEDYDASHIGKIKKLLGVIAESAPFEPNISKIASRLQLGRNTVNIYLKNLHDARVLHLINKPGKGMSRLQKPDKIYFENTAFVYAFQKSVNVGTLRETFFLNQINNSGNNSYISTTGGDFVVNEERIFEIGGKNKTKRQISGQKNAWLAIDDIEVGYANVIPIWLFGFLY